MNKPVHFDKDKDFIRENTELICDLLNAQKIIFLNELNILDLNSGFDFIAQYQGGLKAVSLRCRFGVDYENVNFRNHLSNPKSELQKMMRMDKNFLYSNVILQFNGIQDLKPSSAVILNTKRVGKWISQWESDKGHEQIDEYFLSGTDKYGCSYGMYAFPYDVLTGKSAYDGYRLNPVIITF